MSSEVTQFVAGYSPGDEGRIRFAWQGEDGEGIGDPNLAFRRAVCGAVLGAPDLASVELLRALFRAETEYAREAWCVSGDIKQLGTLLLQRGGSAVVLDFMRGRSQSFDTIMALAHVEIGPGLARELAEHCTRIAATSTEEEAQALARLGVQQFGRLAGD